MQRIGQEVENFSLRSIDGPAEDLGVYLAGNRGVVVLFWSGVCSHCERYDAYLNRFQQRWPELGFVAIASRHGETVDSIRATAAARCRTFPILHDPRAS